MIKLSEFGLREPPAFPDALWDSCRKKNDFRPILYEIYKHTGILAIHCAQIHPSSPDLHPLPPAHFALLAGLLNRCCRLMLSNIKLTDTGLFAETSRILDRCIMESAFRIRWLCQRDNPDDFRCCIADGMKPEVELRQRIRREMSTRGSNAPQVIEARMLMSIDRLLKAAGMTEEEVLSAPRMPRFDKICEDLGLSRGLYLAVHKIGSHPIHGTWSDLMTFYLEWDEAIGFRMADHNARPHDNQYIFTSLFVLDATESFLSFITNQRWPVKQFAPQFGATRTIIWRIHEILCTGDLETDVSENNGGEPIR